MAKSFNDEVEKTVFGLLHDVNRPPFLFLGSGISRRYMGAPDWEGLLVTVCASFDFMYDFERYANEAASRLRGLGKNELYPQIATLMEGDFLKGIYDNPGSFELTDEMQEKMRRGIPAMKFFVAEILQALSPDRMTGELALLRKAQQNVAGVITTNYDSLAENLFPQFDVYSSQSEMVFAPLAEIGEIYKMHGSVDVPETMVLDTDDYERQGREQQLLLAKIMTIFAEYPIIFLGYSFNDEDVRSVLATVASCAGSERARELSERFIFVDYSTNHKIIDKDFGSDIEMKTIRTDDFAPIYRAISRSPQRFTPKVVRQLRKHIYRAAYSGEEADAAMLADFKGMESLPEDMPIVIGLASGYGKEPKTDELYTEMLFGRNTIPVSFVINLYADALLKKGSFPLYYFASQHEGNLPESVRTAMSEHRDIDSFLNKTELKDKEHWRNRKEKGLKERSVQGLMERFRDKAYKHLTILDAEEINIQELESMLQDIAGGMMRAGRKYDSWLRKDIRILDFLKYHDKVR